MRRQDVVSVFVYTSWNPVGSYIVWDVVKSNFKNVYDA